MLAATMGIGGILGLLGIIIYLTKFVFLILLLIPLIICLMAISLAVQAGMMMVVYDEKVGGREALRKGFKKVVPLIGAGVLTLIFTLGGYFVFIIPGVIFTFLLSFASYEVVLNNKGSVEAMKRSIYMVKANWQEILAKLFLFILFSIVVLGIVPSILTNGGPMGRAFSGLYTLIVNSVYSWYSICYFMILYKSLKDKTPGVTGKGLWIMGTVGILGWVIMILLFGTIASLLPEIIKNMPMPTDYSAPLESS